MDYMKLLEHSYTKATELDECRPDNRLEYLGDQVFDFTTYDGEMSALFAEKAIEVCDAINKRETLEYIKEPESYKWFLLMCNMPFFAQRLEWGTSIRGAWWRAAKLESCGLWQGDEQVLSLDFTREQWAEFAKALVDFARGDARPNNQAHLRERSAAK
jgi:hypothetical protein